MYSVFVDRAEILLCLLRGACAQPFVVLDLVALPVLRLLFPGFVLRHRVEADLLLASRGLDDRSEKLFEEVREPCEGRPPSVDEVDDQAFDVRTVEILVSHDHDGAIPQALQLLVVLPVEIQAHDFDDVLDLLIGHHLLQRRIAHVEHLASEREHAVLVAADDAQPCHRQGLGGVALGQDERALRRVFAPGVVGVLQLWHPSQPRHLAGVGLQLLAQIKFGLREGCHQDKVYDAAIGNVVKKLVRQFALGAEFRRLRHQGLLRLRVEGRILDEAPDEDPQVGADVVWPDVHASLHLFLCLRLDLLKDRLHDLVRDMRHVSASSDGADRIHKTHLLEPALREAEADLPAGRALLVDLGHALPREQVQVGIIFEALYFQFLSVEVHGALLVG
mmetsp:Transcript_98086/g.245796  ORF Transcript_98086/g.245796 Transcript_98086/m.245796 type:complete len:390 (+) Transcript_98086:1753-2922(+)